MEWTETERGGKKLTLDGYIYVKKKNLAGGWESYECELRRNRHECKARIKVKVSGYNEFRERTEHNHPPDHGKANAYKVKAAMKRMAVETDQSPHQILMGTMHQATEEGLMAMPGLNNIRRSIRRQRQDSREALAMDMMVKDLENFEGHRSLAAGEAYLMAHPGLNNSQRSIRCQWQDSRIALAKERMVEKCEDLEDNRSVAAGEGLMTQPGLSNIWRSIRRQHQDIREAFGERRAEEDPNIDEDHRPSLAAEEGSMALPVGRDVRCQNQDVIQEALVLRRNADVLEVSGDQLSSRAGEQYSLHSGRSDPGKISLTDWYYTFATPKKH